MLHKRPVPNERLPAHSVLDRCAIRGVDGFVERSHFFGRRYFVDVFMLGKV
jgi:hypothetical protein